MKKKLLPLLGAAIVAASAAAFWVHQQRAHSPLELYYSDPQAMFLVPVTLDLPNRSVNTIVRELGRAPKGLSPLLPKDASASASLSGEILNVTLQTEATGAGSEALMANALVKSLGQLGSKSVKLSLVDPQGRPLESEHVDLSAPLRPDDPTLENSWQAFGPATRVYWSTPDGNYLVPLKVPLDPKQAAEPIRSAFQTLLDGPQTVHCTFLASSVPRQSASLEGIKDGVATVKIEPETSKKLPADTWNKAQRAIVLTLTEFRSVHAVRFDPPGQTGLLERPTWVNRVPETR